MAKKSVMIPDLGGADQVEVIELCMAVGDSVAKEDPLVVLESDKASMEVPSPFAGTIASLAVAVGDEVVPGQLLAEIDEADESGAGSADAAEEQAQAQPESQSAPAPAAEESASTVTDEPPPAAATEQLVVFPDLGGAEDVEVIELCVAVGDQIAVDDPLVTLESDKASMDVPSPVAGEVVALLVAVGDKASVGGELARIRSGASAVSAQAQPQEQPAAEQGKAQAPVSAPPQKPQKQEAGVPPVKPSRGKQGAGGVYAGPAVRKLAREMGLDLGKIKGGGRLGRILKEDLAKFIKDALSGKGGESGVPKVPEVDFSKFGEVELVDMSRLHRATATNMLRSWLNVPHVTHFDEADYTELAELRKSLEPEMKKRGVKLTPLSFLIKACAMAMKAHPQFNVALHPDGRRLFSKKYEHIGVAVDTPHGLMVPVVRDAGDKNVWDLAAETLELAEKAREKKLKPADMQGGCFTISSLGNIGGLAFTPIVNAPEVAILGVSRLAVKPVHQDGKWLPRKMLPLSLSYDHRAVNGADAGRFMTTLAELLASPEELME